MDKTYISTQKFILESPRKLREVVAIAKKMKPMEAIERLPFTNKKAAGNLIKVIKSALANARVSGANDSELIFSEIQIGEGPRLKRGQAASRGRYHAFKRRMSHIRVVLTAQVKGKGQEVKEVVKTDVIKENGQSLPLSDKKEVKAKVIKKKGNK
jgi:large subunit ribosomal protein L22